MLSFERRVQSVSMLRARTGGYIYASSTDRWIWIMLRVRTGGYGLCFECGQMDIILANENHRPSRFAARSRLILHGTASNRVWRPRHPAHDGTAGLADRLFFECFSRLARLSNHWLKIERSNQAVSR